MEWYEYMQDQVFITDLGENQIMKMGSEQRSLERYAAWSPVKNSKSHQVIEVSQSLEYLMEKYGVSRERVCSLL